MKHYVIELVGYDGAKQIKEFVYMSAKKPSLKVVEEKAKEASDLYRWIVVSDVKDEDGYREESELVNIELEYFND